MNNFNYSFDYSLDPLSQQVDYLLQTNEKVDLFESGEAEPLQKRIKPAIVGSYSKELQATQKLEKQLSFARAEQKGEIPKGFAWVPAQQDVSNEGEAEEMDTSSEIGSESFKGLKCGLAYTQGRRKEMEDAHLIAPVLFSQNSRRYEAQFFGVFDGHGGNEVSDYLSKNFQEILTKQLNSSPIEGPSDNSITEALAGSLLTINTHCRENFESGSTVCCAFVFDCQIYVANVGDARTILVKKTETIQLSEDAKPLNPRFYKQINAIEGNVHQITQYIFKKEEASDDDIETIEDASRNGCRQDLSMSQETIGRIFSLNSGEGSVSIARTIGDPDYNLSAKAKMTSVKKEEGDFLIIACDGLWDVATTDEVGEAVRQMNALGYDEKRIASELTDAGLKHNSMDNISVIVVRM